MSSSLIILYIALKAQSVRLKTMLLNNHKTLTCMVVQYGRLLISGAALDVNTKNYYNQMKTSVILVTLSIQKHTFHLVNPFLKCRTSCILFPLQ